MGLQVTLRYIYHYKIQLYQTYTHSYHLYCGVRHACVVRWLVRPGRRSLGASRMSRGVCLARRPVSGGCTFPAHGPLFFGLFLSRAHPSLRHAPWLPLLQSILQRRFRSTAGAAIPSSIFSLPFAFRRRRSVLVQSRSVCLSIQPTLP